MQPEPLNRDVAARAARGRIVIAASLAAWLCLSFPVGVAGGQPADDDTLEWIDDYQAALALAQETGRPLLVEFRCAP